jgi:hypothetical protein
MEVIQEVHAGLQEMQDSTAKQHRFHVMLVLFTWPVVCTCCLARR